jgi:hypothetical protein
MEIMKTIKAFLLFLMIIGMYAFGEDVKIKIPDGLLSPPVLVNDDSNYIDYEFVYLNNKLILLSIPPREFKKENIILNNNRYFIFSEVLNEQKLPLLPNLYKKYENVLIVGGDLILINPYPYKDDSFKQTGFPPKPPKEQDEPFVFYFWEDGIKSIKASSVLIEQSRSGEEIRYDESQLRNTFYIYYQWALNMNTFKRAWAEGVSGPGIGEYLDIEFTLPTDHMMVLNGYVNLTRMDLYTANNRVKTTIIESDNPRFKIEYTFDDVVSFSEISFPEQTKKVRMTIKDVYKGTKYDDTCITAIYLKQRPEFKTHPFFRIVAKGTKEYEKAFNAIEEKLKKQGLLP